VTYSIVAFEPATGMFGAAAQSHWFSVGPIVPWVRPGVGAVCTQSIAEAAYGPMLLDRLAAGREPQAALDALLAEDPHAALRQVAVAGRGGATATHTGADCVPFAGHAPGDGFSVQANMMAGDTVWPAMARAYAATDAALPLARRLLAALEAAEAAGGDVRGRQSAALLVAPAEGEPWRTACDLRVDDHPQPLQELARLLDLHDAYALAARGDELVAADRHAEAGEAYERALELAPDKDELLFWAGLAAAQAGDVRLGVARVRTAIERHSGWEALLGRLSPQLAPAAASVREALERRPRTSGFDDPTRRG
jgi:uncharacterized Ntn-hydrolase superfamily protein